MHSPLQPQLQLPRLFSLELELAIELMITSSSVIGDLPSAFFLSPRSPSRDLAR